ncbi:MAG: 4Fe-4S binding protein [Ruminococcaceae bacterium]|nr:4Fe-4S binding protein [Oscillospiraceae bacterium]
MRGIYTPITKIRRQVFTAIARFAYERDLDSMDFSPLYEMPYEIIPGEVPLYRESIHKERAIIKERLRLALGLSQRPATAHRPFTEDMASCTQVDELFDLPLVNVIPFACVACPTDMFLVTNNCRKCLAHPCTAVCPVKAVSMGRYAAEIDNEKCIHCGRCEKACPYKAIVRTGRPCAEACGVDAITSDEMGRAKITDRCVNCGLCIVSCPFAAITDKAEIFQLITAIRQGHRVYAEIAPSFVGQFGPLTTPGHVVSGLKALGFIDVVEVALGADIGSLGESEEYLRRVTDESFLGTSCCPSWADLARRFYPEVSEHVSVSHTPMVATAQRIKDRDPEAKIVFIGPCTAKKIEGLEPAVRPYIDYVITFEELMGMFSAKSIELTDQPEEEFLTLASRDGRNYAVAGNVAQAIAACIERKEPGRKVPLMNADSLEACQKMLKLAKAGKTPGHILEGMACPGGCVGGPGTLTPIARAGASVKQFAGKSNFETAVDNPHAVETQSRES